jgi:hypothetical protein
MKALTIRQPWAELILQGRKTIELRKWTTRHRGPLAIHAGTQVDVVSCRKHGLDPRSLAKGALIGTAEVVEMIEFDQELWNRLRDRHLDPSRGPDDWQGWSLRNPRRLKKPIPCRGLPGLFQVPPEIAEEIR